MTVGEKIAAIAAERGVDLKWVAEKAKIPYATLLSYVNKRKRMPPADNALRIAMALGVDMAWLSDDAAGLPALRGAAHARGPNIAVADRWYDCAECGSGVLIASDDIYLTPARRAEQGVTRCGCHKNDSHSGASTASPAGLAATDGARDGDGSPRPCAERPAPVRDFSADDHLATAVRHVADAMFLMRSAAGPRPTGETYNAARNLRDIADALLAEIHRHAVSRAPLVIRGRLDVAALLEPRA